MNPQKSPVSQRTLPSPANDSSTRPAREIAQSRWKTYAIAYQTLVIKECLRFSRIWMQTLLPPVITTSLYLIIFGKLMGARIGDIEGVSYMEYIVPGLILLPVINNSYTNVSLSFYIAKFQRFVEELLIAPVPNWIILAGFVSGGVARGMVVSVAVTLVTMAFTDVTAHHYAIAIIILALTSVLFSLAGFINAIFAKSFDDISIIPSFVLIPLTYLGGVFYSIHLLPEIWQTASLVNPILYMINGFRFGLLGVSDIDVVNALAIILMFIVVLIAVNLYLLSRGVGIKS